MRLPIIALLVLAGCPEPTVCEAAFADQDGDGYGTTPTSTCDGEPTSFIAGDCDDQDPATFPEATELCDGIDQNCDGITTDEVDEDGDGSRVCDDCNDAHPLIGPQQVEVCNGRDDNCDGKGDEDCLPGFVAACGSSLQLMTDSGDVIWQAVVPNPDAEIPRGAAALGNDRYVALVGEDVVTLSIFDAKLGSWSSLVVPDVQITNYTQVGNIAAMNGMVYVPSNRGPVSGIIEVDPESGAVRQVLSTTAGSAPLSVAAGSDGLLQVADRFARVFTINLDGEEQAGFNALMVSSALDVSFVDDEVFTISGSGILATSSLETGWVLSSDSMGIESSSITPVSDGVFAVGAEATVLIWSGSVLDTFDVGDGFCFVRPEVGI